MSGEKEERGENGGWTPSTRLDQLGYFQQSIELLRQKEKVFIFIDASFRFIGSNPISFITIDNSMQIDGRNWKM